ncbi:MAG: GntR family transcriptional regulator [Deltaproteobacteria bacterium]|nr:GntR family transcriptional regulator [Deltaproteobacteria bacterium]MBW2153850.1 GntR family transcriptional regulator [Deltaproteobacteria bacterium]
MATIKEAILKGEYRPGMRLIPAKMEQHLNLGRIAIREALRALEGSGLVLTIPNKGAVVANPASLEQIKEVFEIRFELEGKAVCLATTKISAQKLSELEEMNRDLSSYCHDSGKYFFYNRIFHLELYSASGWKFLCQIIEQLFDQVLVFRSFYPFKQADIDSYLEDHKNILKSIRAKDVDAARRALINHLRAGFTHLIKQYTTMGEAKLSGGS